MKTIIDLKKKIGEYKEEEVKEEEVKEELKVNFDSAKSFYKKAFLIHKGDLTILKSYNTNVAEYNHNTNKIKVFGWYSKTTGRHINEFLQLYGFDKVTKREMENWNNN